MPGGAVPTLPGATKTPNTLSTSEKWWTGVLIGLGGALAVAVLVIYLINTGWVFVSKSGTKEYADTLVLSLVGMGALLILCGAFYGRIREITIPGGASLKMDAPAELKDAVAKAAKNKALGNGVDPVALEEEAQVHAKALLFDAYWGWPPKPPAATIDDLATKAVDLASTRVGSAPDLKGQKTGSGL